LNTAPFVLYEDNHLLAIHKPSGWLVQGDKTGDETLTDWGKQYLKEKYQKPGAVFLHPTHRIDRPVSGAVLFARTDKALGRMTTLFRDKGIQKTYLAIVQHRPPVVQQTLRHYLLKDEQRNVVTAYDYPAKAAKESITAYTLMEEIGKGQHLLQVFPHTGRPHQIRVQLAAIGCVILGDVKYGAPFPLPDASIALHCFRMEFIHPIKQVPLLIEDLNWKWSGADVPHHIAPQN
jgi:23S rRNA pseudouridine1911/1915/1917 synthase